MPQETTNPVLSDLFPIAVGYANKVHKLQVRKGDGNVPYMAHLLGVCSLVLEHGGDETAAIAALLHDAAEDQGGIERLNEIRVTFGKEVTNIVEACSDSLSSHGTEKMPWKRRKQQAIESVAAQRDQRTLLVEASDKLHNARSINTDFIAIGPRVFDKFKPSPDENVWYYRAMCDAFESTGLVPLPLLSDLENEVANMEQVLSFIKRV